MILLHVFPTFAVGGSQMRFAAIANRFGRKYRHVIAALDGRTDCRERLGSGLDVHFEDIRLNSPSSFEAIARFRTLLRQVRPSRLITYNWGSIECAMANWPGRIPHIHIEDGFGPEEADRQLPRRVLTRRLVLRNATVVLPSQTLYRLASEVWRLPKRVLRYVPNGVDCARFARARPFTWNDEGPVIGTVASLRPEKNLTRLLDAFALVRGRMACRLVIVGDGAERPRLEAYAAERGIRAGVTFTGQIADTERAYAGFDVVALSSDTEQMPTSVLEAMAAGLPVVSTRVGDVLQMVSAPNRAFVTPLDAASMADALAKLLSDRTLARQTGAANQQVARRQFDSEAMFAAYDALFGGPAQYHAAIAAKEAVT